MNKRVYIKTFGCQMNVYDSERMMAALASDGYVQTESADDAELVIMNTCHIREKAAEKVYSDLGRLKKAKVARPDLKVAITGCVAQAEGAEIIRRQPMVDLVIGPQSYHRLPEMLGRLQPGEALVDTDFPAEDKFDFLPDDRQQMPVSAFLSVQEGCDKFCTFCVVPYTRGAERSRPVQKIIEEAKRMVDAGVREINLLGQNVNGYHGEDESGKEINLATLISRLSEIENLWRIRFTTSHPMDMDDELIALFGSNEKLMPFLHLPIQAGSDKILTAMNRHHTRSDYVKIIEKVKRFRPDLALSGDFIVGFPTETEADFLETLSVIDEVGQAHGYSFKYSPRPGTPAAQMQQLDESEKAERLLRLQEKILNAQTKFLNNLVGKEVPVLFERTGKFSGQLIGKSPYNFAGVAHAPNTNIGTIEGRFVKKIDYATLVLEDR